MIIVNEVTKPVDLPEGPKYFLDLPQALKDSTSPRIVSNKVTKPVDLPEGPKKFWDFPQAYKKNLQAP